MLIPDNGIVKVGMEIEIVKWKNSRTYQKVAADLIKAGFMTGQPSDWETFHNYGCKCENGCGLVRSGDTIYPPLVSLTYDASLPETGAEFVTSTVLLEENGLEELRSIWDIVVRSAVWDDQTINKHGNRSSPSVHLHVSALTPGAETRGIPDGKSLLHNDVIHALSLYGPEFIALASSAGYVRGLSFRKPIRNADQNGHHGFIHLRRVNSGYVYIEWRMFEAVYDNWDYIESSAYLAASLTRQLLQPDNTIATLMRGGYGGPFDQERLNEAVRRDDTPALLELFSLDRLIVLRELCVNGLQDDVRGQALLSDLFNKTEVSFGR
jgi:hypothetical protein